MALAKDRKQAEHHISEGLRNGEKLPARALASLKKVQEMFAAKELSDEVIGVLSTRGLSAFDFDETGRWTHFDSVAGSAASSARRRAKEDPIFDELQTLLSQQYEVHGLAGVMRAMRKVLGSAEDAMWFAASDFSGWKFDKPLSDTVSVLGKSARADSKRHIRDKGYVAGAKQLEVLMNGEKPVKKKGVKLAAPSADKLKVGGQIPLNARGSGGGKRAQSNVRLTAKN